MPHQRNNQLFKALLNDDVQKISSILQHYDDSQRRDSILSEYELLCQAIKFGRRRIAYYLLDKGCCVSKPRSTKLPLHLAIEGLSQDCSWTNIVLKLLYAGARVSDKNVNRDTAVHLGFLKGVEDHVLDFLMKVYLEESEFDAVNKDGLSLLHIACTRSKVEFVRGLLMNKTDVNRRVPHCPKIKFVGYTPLHIAVECRNHEIANLLLKHDADIYAQNFNRSTPLHLACYCRDSRMIDLILARDRVTANVIDNNGLSHFMVACTSKEPTFAKEHLRVVSCKPWTSVETLINSCTNKFADFEFAGYSPLNFAAEFGSDAVFKLLMNLGARCCVMTGRLLTPLMLADKYGHEHVARLFKRYCKRYQQYQNMRLWDKNVVIFDECVEKDDESVSEYLVDGNIGVKEIVRNQSGVVDVEYVDKDNQSVYDYLVEKISEDCNRKNVVVSEYIEMAVENESVCLNNGKPDSVIENFCIKDVDKITNLVVDRTISLDKCSYSPRVSNRKRARKTACDLACCSPSIKEISKK